MTTVALLPRLRSAAATVAATAAAAAALAGIAGGLSAVTGVGAPMAGADPLASLGLTHPDYNTGPEGRIPAEALGIEYEREPGPLDFLASVAS